LKKGDKAFFVHWLAELHLGLLREMMKTSLSVE
jgi:hypothetical protein